MPDRTNRICRNCKWQCCGTYPGVAHPDDFETSEDLVEALAGGKWTVDKFHLRGRWIWFVRASVKGMEGELEHFATEGVCTFLGDDGCVLDAMDQPMMCRKIQPDPGQIGTCTMLLKVADMARAWALYQEGVRAAVAAAKQRTSVVRGPWGGERAAR